jgi:hypothetical protein
MDDSFWEEIERFKNVPGGKKMTAGLQLYDAVKRRIKAGIRAEFPGISDDEARRIIRERRDRLRRWEEIK